jgi:hypothetical protein
LQHDITGAIALEPFVGDRGAGDDLFEKAL